MTTPITDESEEPGQFADRFPIPVHIEEDGTSQRPSAADRASYNTFLMSFSDPLPKMVLPRAPLRKEAYLYVVTLNNAPGAVLGFDQPSVMDGVGYNLHGPGQVLIIKAQRELWAWCTNRATGTINLAVLDQFYDYS
jgi:hypothetical protein